MKSTVSLFISLLFLFSGLIAARNDMGEYWKKIMKDQTMPEAIKGLVFQDTESISKEKDHFVKDFDTGHNTIIYHGHGHGHVQPKEGKLGVEDLKPVNLRGGFYKHDHDQKGHD